MNIMIVDQKCQRFADRAFYRELARIDGARVRVVTPHSWRREWGTVRVEAADTPELEVIPVRPWFGSRQHRVMYTAVPSLLSSHRPEILFVNAEPEDWITWQASRAIKAHSPATRLVFLTWRNIAFAGKTIPYKLPWLHAAAEKRVLASPAFGVAYCSEAPALFARLGFNRVTYVPPFVDTDLFSPVTPPLERPDRELQMVFVGRLHRWKGGDLLLQSLAGVRGVHLTMVGNGPEETSWKSLASRLGIDKSVSWSAAVPHEDLPAILRKADVLVLPSLTGTTWREQFGRVLAEAMACGLAVIGSSSGEIPRVIRSEGLIVPEGNPGALRSAVERLRDDPALRTMFGAQARARMIREHSVNVTARLFHSCLSSIIR